jgi:hypothetical protein
MTKVKVIRIAEPAEMVTIICGVKNCGGGYVIRGGKIVKIPPRGPAIAKIGAAIQTILAETKLNVPNR